MKKLFFLLLFFCSVSALAQITLTIQRSEREVMIKTPVGELYGTLVIPLENRFGIVALIIPGSGPTDRDGNSAGLSGQNNSLKMLADSLAAKGLSTLRIDKRGIGKSKVAMPEDDLRFEDMVEDAVRWLRFLKVDERFKKIAVIGHSEGSLVGMLAAELTDASAFVSIAGAGHSADIVLADQLSKQLSPEWLELAQSYIDRLKNGEQLADVNLMLHALFRPSVQPYLISWFKYNPAVEIKNLKSNVLLVQGTNDLQMGISELNELVSACPSAQTLVIDGMNHVLKMVGDNRNENLKSYSDPSFPLPEKLVQVIARFLIEE